MSRGGGGGSAAELARPRFVLALRLSADLIRKKQNVLRRELGPRREGGTVRDPLENPPEGRQGWFRLSFPSAASLCFFLPSFLSLSPLGSFTLDGREREKLAVPLTCCRGVSLFSGFIVAAVSGVEAAVVLCRSWSFCAPWLSWLSSPLYLIQRFPPVSAQP